MVGWFLLDHRHEYPVPVAAFGNAPDKVRIGSTFGSEVGNRLDVQPAIFEREDEAFARELLV